MEEDRLQDEAILEMVDVEKNVKEDELDDSCFTMQDEGEEIESDEEEPVEQKKTEKKKKGKKGHNGKLAVLQ